MPAPSQSPALDEQEIAILPAEGGEGLDYVLAEEPGFAWLQVGKLALQISHLDDGRGVEIIVYRNGQEMENQLGSMRFHE